MNFISSADGKSKAEKVKELHKQVHARIEQSNAKAAAKANKGKKKLELKEGDWVWIRLRKERFPSLRKSKLAARADGPFQIVKKINDNAFQLDLQGKYQVGPTFNITDLIPFVSTDSRSNPFQPGGDDADHEDESMEEGLSDEGSMLEKEESQIDGPMTRGRLKKLQDKLTSLTLQNKPICCNLTKGAEFQLGKPIHEEPIIYNIWQAHWKRKRKA